ncbi:MAG: TIGR01212 family radical SAM protein [Desulfomonile sp.]|nr:TIGR01212 family radical SAM protein [Desulfomonile sp.]
MNKPAPRYRSLSSWLKERFGEPVRKITVDAGLGCPNRDGTISRWGCIYCNPRGSGTGASDHGVSVREQVDRGARFLSERFHCRKFIAYFQSFTNTYGDLSDLAPLWAEALEHPGVVGLAIGTRPDCVADDVLDHLAGLSSERLVWVEYGLQSAHAETLELINRGHGPEAFFDAVRRTHARKIPVVAHLILGLPGESVVHMKATASAVAAAGVEGVKLHPLYVIRGTPLEGMYKSGQYKPFTEQEAIDATLAVLERLSSETVIHRLTSDPHPEELVAPDWMLDKRRVRAHLAMAMENRDVRQGSLWCNRDEILPRLQK